MHAQFPPQPKSCTADCITSPAATQTANRKMLRCLENINTHTYLCTQITPTHTGNGFVYLYMCILVCTPMRVRTPRVINYFKCREQRCVPAHSVLFSFTGFLCTVLLRISSKRLHVIRQAAFVSVSEKRKEDK